MGGRSLTPSWPLRLWAPHRHTWGSVTIFSTSCVFRVVTGMTSAIIIIKGVLVHLKQSQNVY